MAYSSLLPLSLCLLFLFHGCFAQIEQVTTHQREQQRQQRQGQQRSQFDRCQLQNINALEPDRQIKSEAGFTEIWDQNEEQLQCAGVVVVRHTIQQRGLLLPSFINAPELLYVVEGRGVHGAQFPGCPETYQSQQSQSQRRERGEQTRDQHQKVRHFKEGDIIAMPAGVSHWIYNNGQNQLVLVALVDTGNNANQLDQNFRKFFLAGNPQEEIQGQVGQSQSQRRREGQRGQQGRSNNIFGGFDQQLLADAFNIDSRLAQKLQSENDPRGIIVRVEQELEFLSPEGQDEEERREREEEREEREERQRGRRHNGLEETFCTMKLRQNLDDPRRADVYNPRGGRISTVNSFNLPLLRFLRLSAEKGVLYRNGIMAPHWTINAHSIVYVTRGSGEVQIVDNNGQQLFNGRLQRGQLIVVPQNFAVVKRASNEGFEWIAFKTNDNAKINQLAGRISTIRALPEEVVMNSYQISREEARRLKFNRQEATVFSSSRSQQERE